MRLSQKPKARRDAAGGPRLAASEPPLDQRNSSSLDPQRATAAFPSLTSYAAARALAAINDARLALQKAA